VNLVDDYLDLGLALGRHVDGLVDAYYGPGEKAARAASGPPLPPAALAERGRALLADLAADTDLAPGRRRWLEAQVRGLHTAARRLAGERITYLDEIEQCYGIRVGMVSEDELAGAHRALDELLPGGGPLLARFTAWREAQRVPPDKLEAAISAIAEDFQGRTARTFGLPDGERVDFELVTDRPWSGFNYYLGDLRSRVAINVDLPVLAPSLGPLVAHEAYPGHHTEHTRKEVGLVRRRRQLEETIFLVGTPQCVLAEGLADLGFEIIAGPQPERVVAEHLRPLGVPYDADVVDRISSASELLSAVRGNAAILLHDRGRPVEEVRDYLRRWALLPEERAAKAVEFLTDATWRAYIFCYVDGLPRCRRFVGGDPARFTRLISEQLVPADLESPLAA
jgi:hypothetical protein